MGSDFLSNKAFQTVLEENPEQISWSSLREVILRRGKTGKLGVKVHTFQGIEQTYTIITKVKEDCEVWRGFLTVFDRIICINKVDICREYGPHVLKLLTESGDPFIKLFVCQPDRIKIGNPCCATNGLPNSSSDSGLVNGVSTVTTENISKLNSGGSSNTIKSSGRKRELSDSLNFTDLNNCNRHYSAEKNRYEGLNTYERSVDWIQHTIAQSQSNANDGRTLNWNGVTKSHDTYVKETQLELNDLSKVESQRLTGPNIRESNVSKELLNITRLNSKDSENTCSSNQSAGSRLLSDFSDSDRSDINISGGLRNKDHHQPIVLRSNSHLSGSSRSSNKLSQSPRSAGPNTNIASFGGLRSNGSSSSKQSGRSVDKMGKSKGDKIVKKFYKGNSQDSNEGGEELEPLRLADNQHHGKGKVDSRYTHVCDDDRTLSIPLAKDAALSVQDIVFDDSSQTIPIVTQPSYVNNCPCATCVVTSGICQNCGNKPGSNVRRSPSHMVSLVPETTEGLLPENYGPFLLKNPHLALWDEKTRVVEIERGPSSEFPFSYKVKIGKNQDASVEIYTLVESLVGGGPACGKLNIGDWIRSVNGTPIQIPVDAFSLLSNSNKENSLRLVIQRPVGFSQQPGSSSSPPCSRQDKGDKSPQDLVPKSPQELTPTSPLPSPHFSINSRDLREPLLADTPLPGRIEAKKPSGNVDKKEPRKIYIQNINKEENESDSYNTPFPKVVKLPKVKLFLCGSEAERCANLILQGSEINCDNIRQGYAYIDCSMTTNSYGSVVISPSCSNLYATSLSQSSVLMSSMNQSESSDKEDIKCKHCGNEFHCSASHTFVGTVANVDLFVVSNDKFFHNCCTYLFTKYSIFILTFDGAKLLRSASLEISRMQSLSHTIRSFAGYDCHIMSCGVLDGGMDSGNMADEVRTLFYTSSVNMLQVFNVMGPELIDIDCNSASSSTVTGSQQLQSAIWKVITETIQRQHILQPCLILMDHLNSIRERELFLTESQMMEIVRKRLPQYQQDVHQMVVTEMSMCGEIVSGKAAPITLSHLQKIENLVLIEPKVMVDRLHSVICALAEVRAEDRQRWAKVHSYGLIEIQDFVRLCMANETGNHNIAEFMESYGLIFRHYSGQSVQIEYFLPYYALVSSSSENHHLDKKDHVLYLQFKSHGSTQLFFHLLFNIASHTDSPKSFSVQTMNSCYFKHHGITCTSFHQKLEDRIMFLFKREDKTKSLKLSELYSWLLSVCQHTLAQDIQFLLGAPCPLGENCHTSSSPAVHIVDLKENKPQYCGTERIDLLKPLKAWRPKSLEAEKQPLSPQTKPVLLMELKFTVFDKICRRLKLNSTQGRDWRGLAGLMGLTAEEVELYETTPNPPRELLREWSQSGNGTVEELKKLLKELEREDILSDIREAMSPPPPTVIVKDENLPPNILYQRSK